MFYKVFLSFIPFIIFPVIYSQSGGIDTIVKRKYYAVRIEHPPRIDGVLNDVCWQQGEWSGNFTQQMPEGGDPPTQQSDLNVVYDYEFLYVAIRCFDDEPEKMRAVFAPRDEFSGDVAGIAFDSYHDKRTAFEFNLSAAGHKIDLKHIGDFEYDQNWNAFWEGKTNIDSTGWYVEMKIPFSQLRYSLSDSMVWGLHCWRWIDRNFEEDQWQYIPKDAPSAVYLFGELHGVKDIRPPRQVEVLPYVVSKYKLPNGLTENPYGSNKLFNNNIGLDTKIGLSSNFILDATINPDFGQVEADPSELNLSAFETFFQEKRGFFNEGVEIFNFNMGDDKVLYTRRIGQKPRNLPDTDDDEFLDTPENSTILSSAKISGKTSNGLSLGIIESIVAEEKAGVYSEDSAHIFIAEPFTNYMVARVIKDYDDGNLQIGGIFTSALRNLPDEEIRAEVHKSAHVAGVDIVKYFKNKTYYFKGKGIISDIRGSREAITELQRSSIHYFQRPDAPHLKVDSNLTQLTGHGGLVEAGKNGNKWRYHTSINWRSPGFNINDIGYIRQADYIMNHSHVFYVVNKPGKIFREYMINLQNDVSFDFDGTKNNHEIKTWLEGQFHNLWGTYQAFIKGLASYDSRELRGGPALRTNNYWGIESYFHTNWSKNLAAEFLLFHYKSNEDPTNISHVELNLNWYPMPKIRLKGGVQYEKNYTHYKYIDTITVVQSNYLMGKLNQDMLTFTFRAEYYLTPEFSIRFYGSPYLSIGKYSKFKTIQDAHAHTFYERYHYISDETLVYSETDNRYDFTEDGGTYSFDNPDFHFGQFRSNLVFRWEYKLGSVLYFVWSHDQTNWENVQNPVLSSNYKTMIHTDPMDIFLVKFNYYFSL